MPRPPIDHEARKSWTSKEADLYREGHLQGCRNMFLCILAALVLYGIGYAVGVHR
jgi:hypothetical protein